ncbi:LamG-like jellyroll fold domain-containing protein [Streptomyces yaanensis]|uniref:LamG-like jellyroll fold domain-containing protein n=1 Tax=Streptomyces yaanensis TaxID=1142239 RepID=A0ABV7S5S2_9ACTN|nr:LamG-like jellyroll fold domain-containing protein [Streptomyces sp. CGMCC 4.7035]WNB99998.1 LamG-like jellyroll fold domain-containing protein [Streptomyces sp. CGMCC 4.7035]
MLTTQDAMAQGLTLQPLSLSGLRGFVQSWMAGDPHWGGVPRQHSGSAAGHRHLVAAAATRAGRGVGHPQGRGKGELSAYAPNKGKHGIGKSAAFAGFKARTSTRVASKSTRKSTYYHNADGSFSRKVSPFPLNYKDSKGTWRPIDAAVARRADRRWSEKANSLAVDFAAKSSDKNLASFGKDGKSVGFGLDGAAAVAGTAKGSTVSYPQVLPDTDLQLTSTSIGLRQALVLHSARAANSWVFPLELKGLTAKLNKAGGVDLRDANGKGVASIPSAYAFDSKINKVSGERATTHAVTYELITEHGKPALKMTLNAAWLHAKSRVFPVTVDPDTSVWDYVHTTYTESGYAAADRSQEQTLKVGSYDSGTHSAVSFVQDWRDSFDGSGVTLVSANLHLYDIWASTCTPESFNVAQVSAAWDPTDAMTYPGPAHGASIGSVTPSVPNACANTTGDQTGGDWVTVPLDTASMQKWASGTSADYGLAIYATTTDTVHWKQFGSMAFPGDEPYIVYDYTGDVAPLVEATFPANNSSVSTVTPELQAFADFQQNPLAQKYDFKVYNSSGALVVDSGLVTTPNWTVPSGKLAWNTTYNWTAQAYDGTKYSTVSPMSALTTSVPQPFLTSTLSQNDSPQGYDASIGNYTEEATDAHVNTVGPGLDVIRDYNSRDFRTSGAFGAGWSSVFDAKVTEQKDASGTLTGVVMTYPDGSDVGFGKNSDGTFSAPSGRFAMLRSVTTPSAGYTLTDKNDTVYTFSQPLGTGVYGIFSVADANSREVDFTWTSGHITKMKSAVSGRSLNLTWSTPTGATSAHVATVVTDPTTGIAGSELTWTYGYSGDQLTKVCSPRSATKCTAYGYTNGSQFRTEVENAGASSLWQFNESSGTTAASSAGLNEGTDNATYNNVTLSQTGPLAGSTATAAQFNGSSSSVELPPSLVSSSTQLTMSMWFKTTTAPGVLFSYSTLPLSYTMTQGQYTPGIYVGTDGKLNAEFWNSSGVSPIVSTGAVNDGAWHEVVLSGAGSFQTLYLDGVKVGTRSGMISYSNGYHSALQNHTYIGAGFLGGTWPDEPHYSTTSDNGYPTYFNGTIADAAFYPRALTAGEVTALHSAATKASPLLSSITRPSGKTYAAIDYDTNAARATRVTDDHGGVWQLGAPSITGSSQVYRATMLGGAPNQYYRFGESAGASTALDEVRGGTGTYNSVTLGAAGPFTDHTTASFNGTSSKVTLPSGTVPGSGAESVDMWFKTNTTNGVLFGASKDPLGTTTPTSYTPILYVGSSGKLYGEFWFSGGSTKPIGSASAVTDNKWHHVVLSTSATSQSLYLDGNMVGSQTGTAAMTGQPYTYVGAGYLGGNWPDEAHNSSTDNTGYATYFKGSIAEAAFYRSQLSSGDVDAQFDAAQDSTGLLPVKTVNVTDPGGRTLTYVYDPTHGNREISWSDGLGQKTSFGYDTGGFQRTITDPNGAVTTTGHDPRGNVVSVTGCQNQAANNCSTRYFTYYPDDTSSQLTTADPRNDLPLTFRDPRSASATDNTYLTSYGYDTHGNVTSETSPAVPGFPNGRTVSTTFSDGGAGYPAADTGNVPAGLPVKVLLPSGATTSVSYFHNGDVASNTDTGGLVTNFTYDGLGRTLTHTEVSDTYPSGLTTSFQYDGDDSVTKETAPLLTDRITGAQHTPVTTTGYDDDGDVLTQTVSDASGGDASRTKSWTYDAYDQVASAKDANANAGAANGATTTYTYDAYGNKASETAPDGTTFAYSYNANGDLLTQTLKNYTGDPVAPSAARDLVQFSRAYDPAGRLASETDSMGNTTSYTYTDDDLVATVTNTDPGSTKSFVQESDTYDAAGNLVKRVTDNGATETDYAVDAASRTTSTTVDPAGVHRTTAVSYNPDDLVASTEETDSSGWDRVTTNAYDAKGNLTAQTVHGDASGHPSGWWKLDETSGTGVTDSSGAGNTGTATGVTWSGSAANFDGSSTTQGVVTNGPVLDTTASYTVSTWVKMSSLPTHNAAIVSQTGTTNSAFMLQYNYTHTGAPLWSLLDTSKDATGPTFPATYSTAVPAVGAWTHVVGVFDATNGSMKLYVNGTQSGTTGTNTTPWGATGPLTIGRDLYAGANSDALPGGVSNVQVYQRALSASEVSSLYGKGRTGGTVGSVDQQTTRWSYDKRGLATSMTDPNGNTTNYDYDEAGNLAITTDATVQSETGNGSQAVAVRPSNRSGYNTFGEAVEESDANGNVTSTAYDADGSKVSETGPSYTPPGGSAITPTTVWAYDSSGAVASQRLPDGEQSTFLYDQMGNLARTTRPDTSTIHTTYDTEGETLSVTDGTGATNQTTYDYLGRKLTDTTLERYPSTRTLTTQYSYTASATNPGGANLASTLSPAGRTESYGYDNVGERTALTDGAGNTTRFTYDFMGNLQKTIQPDGTWGETDYTMSGLPGQHKEYDASNALLSQTFNQYDGNDNLTAATDAAGHTTTFTYDASDTLTQEVQPVSSTHSITTSFGYDASGHRTRYTDGRGNNWYTTYNSLGLQESVVEPATAQYSSAADSTTTYRYNGDGQVTSVTEPGGASLAMGYDSLGNLTQQSGSGADAPTATRTFHYDGDGRVVTADSAEAGTVGGAGHQAATSETFGYDDRGDLLSASGAAGTSSFGYDNDGLMTSRADAAGTTGYGYDNAGRLSSVNDAATGTQLTVAYNTLSQMSSIQYGTGGQSRTFSYNSRHLLTGDTLKQGASTLASVTYGYDANGNTTSKNTTGVTGASNNTYSYDWADRLTSWNNGTTTTGYAYDDAGNRIQSGADVYTYDARDQLTSDGTKSYSYTARGTLTQQSTAGGNTAFTSDAYGDQITASNQTYGLDALGRVVTDTTQGGGTRTLTYSGAGNTVANDQSYQYTYDPSGGLVGINTAGATSTTTGRLALTDQHDDVIGTFTAGATSLAGSTTYSPLGKVTATSNAFGLLGFQSGWTDPGTSKVNMAARWYNPDAGQFMNKDTLAVDPAPDSAAANPFAYVGDDPLLGTDPSGHCSPVHCISHSIHRAVHHAAQAVRHTVKRVVHVAVHHVTSSAHRLVSHVVHAVHDVRHHLVHVVHHVVHRVAHRHVTAHHSLVHALHSVFHSIRHSVHKVVHAIRHVAHRAIRAVKHTPEFAAVKALLAVSEALRAALGILNHGDDGADSCNAQCRKANEILASIPEKRRENFQNAVRMIIRENPDDWNRPGTPAYEAIQTRLKFAVLGPVTGKELWNSTKGTLTSMGVELVGGLLCPETEGLGCIVAVGAASGAAGQCVTKCDAKDVGLSAVVGAATSYVGGKVGGKAGAGCAVPHSFTGDTRVLMADGTTKRIDRIKVGDEVADSVPGAPGTQSHKVTRVIVTHTDRDFVDVAVAPVKNDGSTKPGARAAHLTTTFHHPFYDKTQAAFVEARHLHVGDLLQTRSGTAKVTGLHLHHTRATTYDLTIGALHTYYVLAGAVPVLVHNSSCPRFVTDSQGNTVELPEVKATISVQKQARHILNGQGYRGGGYFNSNADAQAVLDAYHNGQAQVMGLTKTGNIQIRVKSVTGYDNNPRANRLGVPTHIFMIKGTKSPSVVPMNPNASAP